MTKANKQITLDIELILKLNESGLNVSEYCNEKLWEYMNRLNGIKKSNKTTEEIKDKINKLEKEKNKIEKEKEIKATMQKEGITEKHLKFLKAMNTNIMAAKDVKEGWKKNFGEDKTWSELIKLKSKWAT